MEKHDLRLNKTYSNENIDVSRSANNKILFFDGIPDWDGSFNKSIQKIWQAHGIEKDKVRKNHVPLCEVYIGASKEFFADWHKNKNEPLSAEKMQYFIDAYEFLKKRFGENNVVCAVVHLDEENPHLHFQFTPVVYDQKKEKYKLAVREVGFDKNGLKKLHTDFNRAVAKKYGLARGGDVEKFYIDKIQDFKKAKADLEKKQAELEKEQQEKIKALTVENAKKIENLKTKNEKEFAAAVESFAENSVANFEKIKGEFADKRFFGRLFRAADTLFAGDATSQNLVDMQVANKILLEKNADLERRAAAAQKSESDLKARFESAVAAEVEKRVAPAVSAEKERLEKRAASDLEKARQADKSTIDFLQRKVERLEKNDLTAENIKLKKENAALRVEVQGWEEKWDRVWFDADYLYGRVEFLDKLAKQEQSQKKGKSR